MAKASGVLFDVDGTLLDTNYLHTVAWWRALQECGYTDVTMQQVHHAIGIASDGLVEKLTGGTDQQASELHDSEYEAFKDDIRAFPEAAELVRACREQGHKVVLATSGKKDDLEWMLPAIGLEDDELDGTVTSDDVEEAKPAPDLLQVAMEKFGLDPARTVALGDTVYDVRAAKDAGIPCVALECGGISGAELREEGAAEVYADPATLLKELRGSKLAG